MLYLVKVLTRVLMHTTLKFLDVLISNSYLNKNIKNSWKNAIKWQKWLLGNPEDRAAAFESSWPLLCKIWKANSPICISVFLCCLSKEKGVGHRPKLDLMGPVFCTLNYNQMYFSLDEVFSLKLVRSLIIWPGYYLLYSNLWLIHSWQHVSFERFLFCVWISFLKIQLCSLNEKLEDGRDHYGDVI